MYNLLNKKSIFIFLTFIIIIFLWLLIDLLYSRLIYKEVSYGCFNYNTTASFYDLKPNCFSKEKIVKTTNAYNVFTDENGYRYSGEKKNKKEKLLVFLGDSFTYGVGLNFNETFVGKISNEKKEYNVLNLAIPSYSPTAYLYQLEILLKKGFKPTKIILSIDLSDISDEAGRWDKKDNNGKPFIIKKATNVFPGEKIYKNRWKKFKYTNFVGTKTISNFLNTKLRLMRIKYKKIIKKDYTELGITRMGDFTFKKFDELDQKWWLPYGIEGGLGKVEHNIKKISKLSKENNAEFYILIYPWAVTLEYGQENFNWEDYGKKLCKISDCNKLINSFPEFTQHKEEYENWSTNLFFLHDVHLNEDGHKITAKKILKEAF